MTYSITFAEIEDLLIKHDLLMEAAFEDKQRQVFKISYDSRDVDIDTLFVCKGVGFKDEYFYNALESGFAGYISEKRYDTEMPYFLVTDVKKALSVISIAFYGRPSDAFTLISTHKVGHEVGYKVVHETGQSLEEGFGHGGDVQQEREGAKF